MVLFLLCPTLSNLLARGPQSRPAPAAEGSGVRAGGVDVVVPDAPGPALRVRQATHRVVRYLQTERHLLRFLLRVL